jgi:lipopolysaccharide transport system permease protein
VSQAARATPAEQPAIDGAEPAPLAHHVISAAPAPLGDRIGEVWRSRDLFGLLFVRELRVRYRQTFLGVAWVVLQPLVPALIVAIVLGAFARLPSSGTPYVVFALAGFVVFGAFAGALLRAAASFLRDGQLVTRVYFPRSVLPLASGSVAAADFIVGFAVLIALALALGHVPPATIVLAPLIAAVALVLGLAVGMAVAAVTAHYRDAAIAVPFAVQLLLYASPVVYSTELVPPSLRRVVALNPLVGLVDAFRAATLGTPWPPTQELVAGGLVGIGTVLIALGIFDRASRDLADVV